MTEERIESTLSWLSPRQFEALWAVYYHNQLKRRLPPYAACHWRTREFLERNAFVICDRAGIRLTKDGREIIEKDAPPYLTWMWRMVELWKDDDRNCPLDAVVKGIVEEMVELKEAGKLPFDPDKTETSDYLHLFAGTMPPFAGMGVHLPLGAIYGHSMTLNEQNERLERFLYRPQPSLRLVPDPEPEPKP